MSKTLLRFCRFLVYWEEEDLRRTWNWALPASV
jgi:hypothetical protein